MIDYAANLYEFHHRYYRDSGSKTALAIQFRQTLPGGEWTFYQGSALGWDETGIPSRCRPLLFTHESDIFFLNFDFRMAKYFGKIFSDFFQKGKRLGEHSFFILFSWFSTRDGKKILSVSPTSRTASHFLPSNKK